MNTVDKIGAVILVLTLVIAFGVVLPAACVQDRKFAEQRARELQELTEWCEARDGLVRKRSGGLFNQDYHECLVQD